MTVPPEISVITAVYNGRDQLPAYFASLWAQTYPNLQAIVIDGGSDDGSADVIQAQAERLHYWQSEPDRGIYDAWNKGLQHADGEWVAFIGCDDRFTSPDALAQLAAHAAAAPAAEFVSARARMLDKHGGLINTRGAAWSWPNFKWRLRPSLIHQGALHHRRLFQRLGAFDLRYRIAGDYEFLLRAGPTLQAEFLPRALLACGYGRSSQDAYRTYREVFTIHRRSPHVSSPEAVLAFAAGLGRFYAGRYKHRLRRAWSGATG